MKIDAASQTYDFLWNSMASDPNAGVFQGLRYYLKLQVGLYEVFEEFKDVHPECLNSSGRPIRWNFNMGRCMNSFENHVSLIRMLNTFRNSIVLEAPKPSLLDAVC